MAGPRITHTEVSSIREKIVKAGEDPLTIGCIKLMRIDKTLTKSRAGYIIDRLREASGVSREGPASMGPKETYDYQDGRLKVRMPKTRIHTLDQLIAHCEVDLAKWEVERFTCNKWEMGYVDKNSGVADHIPLFQVKATFRENRKSSALDYVRQQWIETATKYAPIPRKISRRANDTGNLLEIIIPDHHDGTLAWGKETGAADWDLNISRRVYRETVDSLMQRSSSYNFDRVLHVVGNDRMDVDNADNTTTRGTQQDTDSRYPKICESVFQQEVETIELMRRVAEVHVEPVRGNHDWQSMWWMGFALAQYFRNYEDVHVNISPKARRAYEWGNVMLGFTHGDKDAKSPTRIKNLAGLFMAENPEMYGRTKFREIHIGHWHSVLFTEQNGIIVRGLSSLCPPDAWTSESGYIGSHQRADAFYWNKELGPMGTATHAIPRMTEQQIRARDAE